MKNSMLVSAVMVALLAGLAKPAEAINKEWSAVAGFVGGVLVANSYRDSYRGYDRCAPGTYRERIVERPVYVQPTYTRVVYEAPKPRGYYTTRYDMVWVAGTWIYEDAGCGSYRKIWQPGCYKRMPVRVWVPSYDHCRDW